MKILYIVSSPVLNSHGNTGYGRHIRETVKGLELLGHALILIESGPLRTIGSKKENGQSNERNSISSIKRLFPAFIWESIKDLNFILADRKYRQKVKRIIREKKPDLVYERTCYLSSVVSINRGFKLPWFLEVNAPLVEQRRKISGKSILLPIAHKIEKRKYNLSTLVFCVSEALSTYIHTTYAVSLDKLIVNHNGVDTSAFSHIESGRAAKQELVFGFVGSIMPYHGVETLISAFARLFTRNRHIRLLIVGDGYNLLGLKELCLKIGLTDNVIFTGGVEFEKIPELIREMDICMMPNSNWYGSPVKIFEYGSMGKAIIAPHTPAVSEIIENGIDGLLIESDEELFSAMEKLSESKVLRDILGKNIQRKIHEQYRWEDNVRRIASSINSL